jgi:hypothetical protein
MNDIKMPGFTADASLWRTSREYLMTAAPAQGGAIHPQLLPVDPSPGEWRERADSVAAFYGGAAGTFHTPADIAERKMCLALARSCRSLDVRACRLMVSECPHH